MSAYSDGSYAAREPGARRRKIAGYLRAANELRQTYQQSAMQNWAASRSGEDDLENIPGSYPNAAVTRSGEEEMILFPSYARRHVKTKPSAVPGTIQESPGYGRDSRDTGGAGDAEFWRQQWEQYEDDNAIVDVDVRGWVYSPHRGPLTRKARLGIGLARQMMGLPGSSGRSPVSSAPNSRSSSPHPIRERLENHYERKEEELLAKEAEKLARRGEAEGKVAQQGGYSEVPGRKESDVASIYSRRSSGQSQTQSEQSQHLAKQSSWTDPSQMTPEQLQTANAHMMTRLKPFLANPLADTPISAFFYNEQTSRQKTIQTDAAGHFNLRAALDFVPTHVRILASEKLSATKEVIITEPSGVSVISDIDDTVKHSAISNGAREVFRNVLLREFGELSIPGVKDWYSQLQDRGVFFHYVSNSPWQMYPALTEFFAMSGLPQGSFHLKAYTGMFQGIFEPVAERKKSTLERLMRDFPRRRFLLVGDSGEADLEVYTDVVLENPGRVLGVFIRDVTTTIKRGFFDSAMGPLSSKMHKSKSTSALHQSRQPANDENDSQLQEAITRSLEDMEHITLNDGQYDPSQRPALPARKTVQHFEEEDLIDLGFEDETNSAKHAKSANQTEVEEVKKPRPPRPRKPVNLSSTTSRSQAIRGPGHSSHEANSPTPLSSSNGNAPNDERGRQSERSASIVDRPLPDLPPRRTSKPQQHSTQQQGYAAAAAHSISNLYSSATSSSAEHQGPAKYAYPSSEPLSRREELWKRRWAHAKEVLDSRGVLLRAWRSGEDVVQDTINLIDQVQPRRPKP